jgi:glycerate kinase
MRILVAPQALKGSSTAAQTGQAIAKGVQAILPDAQVTIIPIADGGEDTVQTLVDAMGGHIVHTKVTGPLSEPVDAFLGLLGDGSTAVIEMAACAGLPLVPPTRRNPLITTTYGVGELILFALSQGYRQFILGIGGSATNDAGAGMAQALGGRLIDIDGQPIARGGAALASLAHVDISTLDPRLSTCTFRVACDVSNPLCGPEGASAVYGPQKGATPDMVEELDAALAHFATIVEQDLHRSLANIPGAGAAGGLGAGLLAFLPANLEPGTQIIFDMLHLEEHIAQNDLVITAEGQIDAQTVYGKSISAIASLARQHNVPVLALAGGLAPGHEQLYKLGVSAIIPLPPGPLSLSESIKQAEQLTRDATERAMRMIGIGHQMARHKSMPPVVQQAKITNL